MAMILLKEYSERHGKNHVVVLQKAERGGFKSAKKIGRQWFIDDREPYIDNRVKTGRYQNKMRKK